VIFTDTRADYLHRRKATERGNDSIQVNAAIMAGADDPLAFVARQLERDSLVCSLQTSAVPWPDAMPGPLGFVCAALGKCGMFGRPG